MAYQILKTDLNSPTKFTNKLKDYIENLKGDVKKEYNIDFSSNEISELILSACRANDYNVLIFQRRKVLLNE